MTDRLKRLTAEIVSSYVEANRIGAPDLPGLIQSTFAALNDAGRPIVEEPEPIKKPTAAQIRKSITPDALISFVDGRPYRMLKRHLAKAGLTPAEYRARFDLPADYPVTAASYSAKRSALARSTGVGRKPASKAPQPAPRDQ
jgi:predicted transcriptional regulator